MRDLQVEPELGRGFKSLVGQDRRFVSKHRRDGGAENQLRNDGRLEHATGERDRNRSVGKSLNPSEDQRRELAMS
jgi:hypothetical protein